MIKNKEKFDYNQPHTRMEIFHQIFNELEEEERTDNQILASQNKVNKNLKDSKKSHSLHL